MSLDHWFLNVELKKTLVDLGGSSSLWLYLDMGPNAWDSGFKLLCKKKALWIYHSLPIPIAPTSGQAFASILKVPFRFLGKLHTFNSLCFFPSKMEISRV